MTRTIATVYLVAAVVGTSAAVWLRPRPPDIGLHMTLWQADAFDGRPLLQRVTPDLDVTFIDRDPSLPRRHFRIQWEGHWFVDRDRLVDFAAGVDDRVTVWLDGRIVVNRHPAAGVDVAERNVPLSGGAHALRVVFEQIGGGYSLVLLRALDGGAMAPFDPTLLFPTEPSPQSLAARRDARLLTRLAIALWIPAVGWLGFAGVARARRAGWFAWLRRMPAQASASPVAIGLALTMAGTLLLASARTGPDYGRYIDWANAYLYRDVTLIRTPVGSPLGLPLTQWSHGPGLLFSTGRIALGPALDVNTGALVVGWLAALVFWWSLFRILRWAANGDSALVAFGAAAAFVGTHAGFYSHHHASESLSLALVGVLAMTLIERPDGRSARSALVGVAGGLLLITRSNLAVYAVPALLWQAWQIRAGGGRPAGVTGRASAAVLPALWLTGPLVVAAVQVAIVNRWMTGSFARSPYTFGDESFSSLDWTNPELAAVLFHPWHGLLPYHPLYGLGFLALVVLLVKARSPRPRLLCLAALVPVAANLYTQAAWYVWWMGTDTFGSRGMTVAAIPLMAALVRLIAVTYRDSFHKAWGRLLVALVSACAIWSYLMLRQGTSQFLTWSELVDGQVRALGLMLSSMPSFALAAPVVVLGVIWLRSQRSKSTDHVVEISAALLSLLAVSYLAQFWLQRPWFETARLMLPAALLLLAIWAACEIVGRSQEISGQSLVRVGLVGTCVMTTAIFALLAVDTERRLAAGGVPFRFETTGTIHTPEVIASYGEYQRVAGFEDKKRALAAYLGIDR